MKYFRIEPAVLGDVYSENKYKQIVLNVVHWFNDDIVELNSLFLITDNLKNDFYKNDISGLGKLKKIIIKKSIDSVIENNRPLYLLEPNESNLNDIYIKKSRLYVSEKALNVINKYENESLDVFDANEKIKSPWD